MGEKRKPSYVILLKKQSNKGSTYKIELFDKSLWE
ncbi:unnamed protein product, partial [marine sediment metagenome]